MLKPIIGGYGTIKFREKTFAGGSKMAEFMNVFSLERFLLYGIIYGFITAILHFVCTYLYNIVVLSTVLQMAGLGFTVGTLAIFLEDQVHRPSIHILSNLTLNYL